MHDPQEPILSAHGVTKTYRTGGETYGVSAIGDHRRKERVDSWHTNETTCLSNCNCPEPVAPAKAGQACRCASLSAISLCSIWTVTCPIPNKRIASWTCSSTCC